MTPESVQNRSALIGEERTSTTTPASAERSAVDAAAAVVEEMRARGIDNPEEHLAFASPDAILGACRDWDSRRAAGPGLLSRLIRDGGKPGWQPRASSVDREREYGNQIRDWLNENFPDLEEPSGNPHPAAIAAVIRLHYTEGKGQLTKAKHGPVIRAAVRAWAERWGSA